MHTLREALPSGPMKIPMLSLASSRSPFARGVTTGRLPRPHVNSSDSAPVFTCTVAYLLRRAPTPTTP